MPEADSVYRDADAFTAELLTLEASGAVLPVEFKPSEAWYLFAALQLVLTHPNIGGEPRKFLDRLARNIEGRLCRNRPVMQEVARRGWEKAEELAAEERTAAAPPPDEDTEMEQEQPKRNEDPPAGPKRKPDQVAPENKMVEPPENKAGKGRKKR